MSKSSPGAMPKTDVRAAQDRLAAVGFIASLVGHRARNRLATIRAALELLDAGMEANMAPAYRAALLRELDDFVGDFNLGLDMVRCDFGPLVDLSARASIEGVLGEFGPLAQRQGVRLGSRFDPAADRVLCDRRLLRLVLLNLLRNSIQALEGVSDPAIAVRTESSGGRCAIEVEDNGPGIPADLRDRLLTDPSPGRGGTGLGLVLCRDAMTIMGGTIHLATPVGEAGARFRLEFSAKNPIL
jgi:signal transduction histidine kinase